MLILPLAVSCTVMMPSSDTQEQEVERVPAPPARLSDEVLEAAGLEEDWFLPPPDRSDPREGETQAAYLLPEGLITVTMPREAGAERLMKLFNREEGLAEWWYPIDGPVVERPFSYHYTGDVNPAELYFRIHDTVYCLDLQYGALLWSKSVDPPIDSSIVANDTHFYFGSTNGRFYGFEKNSPFEAWNFRTGGPIDAGPVFAGGKVCFGSHDGHVFGLTPERGYVSFQSWDTQTRARVTADLAAYSRWVFAASQDYKLYCLEASDGSIYWSFGAGAPIVDAPVVYRHRANNEYVFVIASEGSLRDPKRTLFAVPIPKGEVAPPGVAKWSRPDIRKVVAIGEDTIYALSDDDKSLVGLSIEDGEEKFSVDIDGFHFVPTNSADSGRRRSERGKIYLVSRSGAIQVIREKI